jgi:beta-glucosidase
MDPIFYGRYPAAPGLTRFPEVQTGDFQIIGQPLDFLGINYYTRLWSSTDTPPLPVPKRLGETDMGWEIHPQGLTELLLAVHRDYRLPPVYITENGAAFADRLEHGRVADADRIEFVRSHLAAVQAAMAAGVDVRGYFYWSLMDNYEWNSGYDKRFGIVHVDYATQQRTLKDSALWYRNEIARWRDATVDMAPPGQPRVSPDLQAAPQGGESPRGGPSLTQET